mgnify:CR=1 FL=1
MNKVEFSRAAKVPFEKRYGNFIGGKWAEPRSGKYFENTSPVNGQLQVPNNAHSVLNSTTYWSKGTPDPTVYDYTDVSTDPDALCLLRCENAPAALEIGRAHV